WNSSGLGLPAWVDVTPLTGTITPGNQKDIKVTLDAATLTPDTYFADMFVNSNDPDEPFVQIPVTLEVLPITDVEEAHSANTPDRFYLFQNYPNPFNPETSISFELPDAQKDQTHVGLSIYNMQGQLVRQLVNENKSPGAYSIKWNAKNDLGEKVPSGIYVYTLTAGDFKTSRKMLLLK
ncbi:MAG: T9SS type A sorting domain-containing protein, partial [Simkaniaceae bacterium]|nr:T9SS type A sorting domain-containing protein [Simkaniaceae bacterium]